MQLWVLQEVEDESGVAIVHLQAGRQDVAQMWMACRYASKACQQCARGRHAGRFCIEGGCLCVVGERQRTSCAWKTSGCMSLTFVDLLGSRKQSAAKRRYAYTWSSIASEVDFTPGWCAELCSLNDASCRLRGGQVTRANASQQAHLQVSFTPVFEIIHSCVTIDHCGCQSGRFRPELATA